jgi:alpha-beta hydrolase superfamily lysophospholipase
MMPMNIEVWKIWKLIKNSLLNAGQKLQIPYLIIQGTNDAAVKMEEFDLLKKHFSKAKTRLF